MLNILNRILFYGKVLFLLIVFTLTLFISFRMQEYYQSQIWTVVRICIPLFLALSVFIVSLFFKEGDNNILFNVACLIAFAAIMIIDFRTLLDRNMLLWTEGSTNFYYFQNQLSQIKILTYCIFFGNILLIYKEKLGKKEIETI